MEGALLFVRLITHFFREVTWTMMWQCSFFFSYSASLFSLSHTVFSQASPPVVFSDAIARKMEVEDDM